jgi:regulator of replication initiation timing
MTIEELKAENARLKAKVERLTAENASVKLGNAELRQMVIERGETAVEDIRVICRLEAEVERLTKQVERLIVSLQKSHDEHGEALYKLKYKNERQTPRKKRSS